MSKLLTLNGTVITRNGNILLAPEGSGLQNKTVTPTESTQSVTYDDGYEGLGTVTVNPISSTYVGSEIPTNPTPTASGATVTIPTGYYSSQTTKSVSTAIQATPTISVSSGGLITASATQTAGYVSSGTKSATEQLTVKSAQTYTPTTSNQTISSGQYLTGNQVISGDANLVAGNIKNGVSIFGVTGSYSGGGSAVLDSLEVTPSESVQQFDPEDYDVDGWDYVEVGAISSTYIGSGITVDPTPTASGDTVTIPTGYYSEDTTKSISSGSATTPATTITANPSISVDSSTGVITATTSTTQSVTPTVSAGYVSSGTAGTITVSGSNTSNLTTQAAQTIYPSTSDQTISSGTYLTGTQTIKAVITTNLSAANIKDGVTVEIGDSSDSDRVATVTGTFTDSSTVSSGQVAASSSEILDGYSAWVDGAEVQGSHKDQSSKSYTVSASGSQTISPDSTYDAMEAVALSVPSGTEGTPTATKGTVSSNSISVTPSVTNSGGWISGGTTTGTAVTVSASELVSGTKSITSNGTNIDVTNYAAVDVSVGSSVNVQTSKSYTVSASGSATISPDTGYDAMEEVALTVPSGSATGPSSLSGSSATVSTGTNTLTLTKTGVTTTPTVSAGYVSSATASTATVALTASVTTKGATTYTPGTSDQTIASGTYLTGTQTISGDSDLVAGNIKKDVSIFGVTGTYEGSGGGGGGLPDGYIRIPYIEGNENQYIDTGIVADSNTKVECEFQFLDPYTNYLQCIFGSQDYAFARNRYSNVDYFYTWGSTGVRFTSIVADYEWHLVTKTATSTILTDASLPSETKSTTAGSPTLTMSIMADHLSSGYAQFMKGRIASCRIWSSTTLVRDYIPVINSSSVAGLYDLVNNTFNPSVSGTNFIAGEWEEGGSSIDYYTGATPPSAGTGSNGDIYLQTDDTATSYWSLIPDDLPNDGATRLGYYMDSNTPSNRMTAYIRCTPTVAAGVTIDWGDGTTTTTSSTSATNYSHTYTSLPPSGYYIQKITCTSGTVSFVGSTSNSIWGANSASGSGTTINNARVRWAVIGTSCTKIGSYAFYRSYGLEEVKILNNNCTFDTYAFSTCYGLKRINIPSGSSFTSIPNYCFYYCYGLGNLTLPANIVTIGSYAFNNCANINLTIKGTLTSISSQAFNGCRGCLNIPLGSITTLNTYALATCSGLTSLTIPSTVTTINANAFSGCYSLGEIHFKSSTPPEISATSAYANLPTSCKIYVPTGKLDTYTGTSNYPSSTTYTYVEE